jgi:hypothetical protein
MSNYDRRASVNRLTPLTQEAAKEIKKGVASLELASRLLDLVEREAREQLPRGYHRTRMAPPKPEDKFEDVAEHAKDLRGRLEGMKPSSFRSLVELFDELASETRAHMGE